MSTPSWKNYRIIEVVDIWLKYFFVYTILEQENRNIQIVLDVQAIFSLLSVSSLSAVPSQLLFGSYLQQCRFILATIAFGL